MDIGSVLGSAATGGVLGGLFSLGNAAVEFVNARQQAKEALEQTKVSNAHEIELNKLNAANAIAQTQLQGVVDEIKASFEGLQASMADQTGLGQRADTWTVDILALFRPGLTVLLVGGALISGWIVDNDHTVFNSMIELSAMAVAWWFGDRQRAKFR